MPKTRTKAAKHKAAPKPESPPSPMLGIVQDAYAKSGLTQAQLAERTGIAQGNLSNYLRGQKIMRVDTLEKLADVLGLKLVRR